jgi:hypothetical protein
MKNLNFLITAGTEAAGIETFYFPVPCRGVVHSLKAAFDTAVAADDTVDIQRDSTSVNLITTGATTAGKVYTGTPDATNKDLVFDPDSSTEAYKMLKIVISALATKNTVVGITIEYDDSAYVEQAASEA